MTLTLPFPPSTNTAYSNVRNRRVKTKRAREYAADAQLVAATDREARMLRDQTAIAIEAGDEQPRLAVRLDLHPPRNGRADIANYEKLAIDAVFTYLGIDDSLIDDLHIIRHAVEKPGRLVMTIHEVDHA